MTTISEYTPKPASFAVVPPGTCQLEETPKALELLSKQQISPDTYIFTFGKILIQFFNIFSNTR